MKTILFISANKILAQGLSTAILSKQEVGYKWTTHLNYAQAMIGVDIITADMVIFDIVDQNEIDHAVKVCQRLRSSNRNIKILFLVRPEQENIRNKSVDAQNAGIINNFIFYDNSMNYLLAKLEAL